MIDEIDLAGMGTRWFEWGPPNGIPVLCLHPLGQNGSYFKGLADSMGDGWRVVSFDQRGHGEAASQPVGDFWQFVDDAEAVLTRIGGRAHLVGFSMGGSIAALLAARRPGAVLSLTLAATPFEGQPVFAERACATERGSIDAIARETISRWFGRLEGDPAIRQAASALEMMTPKGFDAAWRAFARFEGYDALAVHLPSALCLAFSDDLSTPPIVLDRIAQTISASGGKALRKDIAGAGHMGLLQKPAEVAAILIDFIATSTENENA